MEELLQQRVAGQIVSTSSSWI